jgi:hypothetical protein
MKYEKNVIEILDKAVEAELGLSKIRKINIEDFC